MAQELDKAGAVLNLYKKKSETPLHTIERYVAAHPEFRAEFKNAKLTYAGRLDPMAEGLLVVLVGSKNQEREAYTGLDKDYEFEFVTGVVTDTHDVLGKVTTTSATTNAMHAPSEDQVKNALKKYTGTFEQKYPAYSSKVLNGVQLFQLAREGKVTEAELPTHQVTVSKLELVSSRVVSKDELVEAIYKDVSCVAGDFRQKDILKAWTEYFHGLPAQPAPRFRVYRCRVSCGSGFYVRQLVQDIGRDLGTGAVTTSIVRTRVGDFKLADSIR